MRKELLCREILCRAGILMLIALACLAVMAGPGMGMESISVQSYQADLYLNGTLQEKFVYQIEEANRYRMLYRSWKLPLSAENLSYPYVEPLRVDPPSGTVGYAKERDGELTLFSSQDGNCREDIRSLAELNEAGCYNPNKFSPGVYNLGYLFRIHPSIECDASFCHWNLRLADDHYPYQQVTINIHDPKVLLIHPIPHPDMYYQKKGDVWSITGSSPENGLLEVEMLLLPNASARIAGFSQSVSNIEARTISAQKDTSSSSKSSQGNDPFAEIFFWIVIIGFFILAYIFREGGGGGRAR